MGLFPDRSSQPESPIHRDRAQQFIQDVVNEVVPRFPNISVAASIDKIDHHKYRQVLARLREVSTIVKTFISGENETDVRYVKECIIALGIKNRGEHFLEEEKHEGKKLTETDLFQFTKKDFD